MPTSTRHIFNVSRWREHFCKFASSLAPQAYFFCCSRKSMQKEELGTRLYCAHTRAVGERHGACAPQICYHSDSFWIWKKLLHVKIVTQQELRFYSIVGILGHSATKQPHGKSKRAAALLVALRGLQRGKSKSRPRKLHIPRFRINAKARPFRCSSFPKRKRFAGLHFGSVLSFYRQRLFLSHMGKKKGLKRLPASFARGRVDVGIDPYKQSLSQPYG